ncbi:MAG: response regulator, partial [Patescibacteria group bacterium]
EMVRIYFRDIFWIHGMDDKYDLNVVDNLKKAEEIIANPETRPAILFLDLVMPTEINGRTVISPEAGFGLLKKIKSSPDLKNIKVIVFSGHTEEALQKQAEKLGAETYLIKGSNLPKELVEFVEKIAKK